MSISIRTVTVGVNTDWLNHVNGLTVAQAIDYLHTLDQTLMLSAWLDGEDLQGIEIGSGLYYTRPETPEEAVERRRKFLFREIHTYTQALSRHTKNDCIEGISRCTLKFESLQTELEGLAKPKEHP